VWNVGGVWKSGCSEQKFCNISETLLLTAYIKSHTSYRLLAKRWPWMTSKCDLRLYVTCPLMKHLHIQHYVSHAHCTVVTNVNNVCKHHTAQYVAYFSKHYQSLSHNAHMLPVSHMKLTLLFDHKQNILLNVLFGINEITDALRASPATAGLSCYYYHYY